MAFEIVHISTIVPISGCAQRRNCSTSAAIRCHTIAKIDITSPTQSEDLKTGVHQITCAEKTGMLLVDEAPQWTCPVTLGSAALQTTATSGLHFWMSATHRARIKTHVIIINAQKVLKCSATFVISHPPQ